MTPLLIYLYWINILTFVLYAADKRRAIRHERRVPNAILLMMSCIGGALGALCAMLMFRHKTNKIIYNVMVPLTLFIWTVVGCILFS